jgi:ABC-2 type transport system ATP-binding protein
MASKTASRHDTEGGARSHRRVARPDGRSGLVVSGLSLQLGQVAVLDRLDLRAPRGRVLGLLGPNGAGKTSVMRCMTGIFVPDEGEIRVDGRPIDAGARRRIGYMPEERGLYPKMELGEQVRYFARLHGRGPAEAARACKHWLDRLGLSGRAGDRVEALSHGNQQRAQLAVALVHDPDLLLLDEPFAGLDPGGVEELAAVLREQAEASAAVVFSSHQLDLVEQFCDEVAIVDRGRLVLSGALPGVKHRGRGRLYEVGLEGADDRWAEAIPGVSVVDRDDGIVRFALNEETDPQTLLREAQAHGRLTHFTEALPPLSDVFREAVAR